MGVRFQLIRRSLVRAQVANNLAQTFALLYQSAGLEGAISLSGRRTFLTNLANKGTAIHILKTLAGHRSISSTAAYLYRQALRPMWRGYANTSGRG
ncbi:MAG: site-specific integrase [Betaproteobacteria bacterium]|nr:site-specific integrase [Betaproteobacteria bacterium]